MIRRSTKSDAFALSAALREAAVAEYKMRAVCRAAIDGLGNVAPFTDVRAAVNQRCRALAALAIRFGVSFPHDPFAPFRVGVAAHASSAHACRAAAVTARRNIAMYERLLAQELPPEVRDVLERLLDGTRGHHLPAFERGARSELPREQSAWFA